MSTQTAQTARPLNRRNMARSYQQASLQTAPRGRLTLMLFDGALRFISEATAAFEEDESPRRLERIHNTITRAQAIILELQSTVDLSVEGDLPQTLFRLYDYIYAQLQKANLQKRAEPLDEAESCLRPIRDAWAEMLEGRTTAAS